MVARHIVTISRRKMENFFNRAIQDLSKEGLFPDRAVDSLPFGKSRGAGLSSPLGTQRARRKAGWFWICGPKVAQLENYVVDKRLNES
jgi:hypothetical protein